MTRAALRGRLESLYSRVVAIECGSARPGEVAFCSGSGNSAVVPLMEAGVDTLVTGELREEWFNVAQENALNLYLCGHYATEVHAVRALAAEVSAKFGLPWEFIATENPL
jgi:putative NIF3 family GTP cyclohydrolase 1 type 2